MSGGALSLTVHAAAIALLLILGFAPIERQSPLPPLETSLIPLPEPILLEAVQPKSAGDGAAGPGPPRRDPARAAEDRALLPAEALTSPVSAPDRPAQAGTGAGGGPAGSSNGDGADGPGSGGAAHGDNMTFARPEWIHILSPAQMRPYFPRKAIYDRVDGRAALACQVDRRNRARNCRVLSESPPGFGFGVAALRMSRLFRIRPPRVNGLPQRDAWVRIPIDFDVT